MVILKLLATHPECIYFLFELSIDNFPHTVTVELQEWGLYKLIMAPESYFTNRLSGICFFIYDGLNFLANEAKNNV